MRPEVARLNAAEPSIAEQVRKRVLLIGRHDYWPGYTPAVIEALDFDLWPSLALAVDAIAEQREQEARDIERMKNQRPARR